MVATARGKKNMKIDETTKAQTLKKVEAMSAEKLNDEFSQMQLQVQKVFAGLQADVTNRFATCSDLDTAIALKQAQLKDLHGIEAAAVSLDDLQAQLEAQRQQIADERDQADQAHAQLESERASARQKLEDEWKYTTDQKHRKTLDDFQQELLKKQRDEAARQEALQKTWKDREESLAEREAELDTLRKQVENFPKNMDTEVKKQVAIAENAMKREYETRIQLLTKDAETAKVVNTQREDALNGTIKRLESQNAALQQQVSAAEMRATEVAKTALESVSGRDALAAVQQARSENSNPVQGKAR